MKLPSLPTSAALSPLFKRVLILLLGAAAVLWVCTFKLMDRDFWWHITAGDMMLKSWTMIDTDPFAYTRAGLPYLATHEWLAQILLALIYNTTGATGMIIFRAIIACSATGLLLLLGKKNLFFNVLLAVWAVVITKGSYLERPQLFTFVFFAAFILLAFRFLDSTELRSRIRLCISFIVLELLWVNMHGGAALLGGAIVTWVTLQQLVTARGRITRGDTPQILLLLGGTLIAMGITLILPPNGFETISYVVNLLNDQTIVYIAEWQPRSLGAYLSDLWPFWLLSITALLTGRRQMVFNGLLLLMTAYLSRQAIRHEILFIYAAIATVFYQFNGNIFIEGITAKLAARSRTATTLVILLLLFMTHTALAREAAFERRDTLYGFGQFDFAKGAADYLEQNGIAGNMFNTYGIGGYLIHRGFPVYIDGRNVDYGMDFMTRTYAAGINEEHWQKIVDDYDITYAVVDYDAIRLEDHIPYSKILDNHAQWTLTYIDDWTAVYLKNTPENEGAINRSRYALINPTRLQFQGDFSDVPESDIPALGQELMRMQNSNNEGVKAALALANLAIRENRFDDARTLAETVMLKRPYAPEPHALLATIHVHNQQWEEAADEYVELLRLAGNEYPDINYTYIADIFKKGGHPLRAWYYGDGSATEQGTGAATAPSDTDRVVNPAMDAVRFHDEALKLAENGEYTEAEVLFLNALKVQPSYLEAWTNLCALYIHTKQYQEAVKSCQRAIEINPAFGDAHYNLALAYFNDEQFEEAEAAALKAQTYGRQKESDVLLQIIRRRKAQ